VEIWGKSSRSIAHRNGTEQINFQYSQLGQSWAGFDGYNLASPVTWRVESFQVTTPPRTQKEIGLWVVTMVRLSSTSQKWTPPAQWSSYFSYCLLNILVCKVD